MKPLSFKVLLTFSHVTAVASVKSRLLVILGELWLYALFGLLALLPFVAFMGARWEDMGLSYAQYDSMMFFTKVVVLLLAVLALASIVLNAQFQDSEKQNCPSQADQE